MTARSSKPILTRVAPTFVAALLLCSVATLNSAGSALAQAAPALTAAANKEKKVPGLEQVKKNEKKEKKVKKPKKGKKGKSKGCGPKCGKKTEEEKKAERYGGGGEGSDSSDKRESRAALKAAGQVFVPTRAITALDLADTSDLAPSRSVRPPQRPNTSRPI